jgi:asparagine N-glycosylation enzyme membrane subunit Stt3
MFIGYGIGGNTVSLIASLVLLILVVLPLPASAWNIPGHMLSAAIAYQVLQQESPGTIAKVKAVLEKHPWYANQWQARLQDVPILSFSGFSF